MKAIEKFGQKLNENSSTDINVGPLTDLIHREGINVRYLGKLRNCVTSEKWREIILTEMISRICKNLLRHKLRQKVLDLKIDQHKKLICDFLNKILGFGSFQDKSKKFWTQLSTNHLSQTFPNALDQSPSDPMLLKAQTNLFAVIQRICELCDIDLTPQALSQMKSNLQTFQLVISDIKKGTVKNTI
jgi:hypothetical protein